MLDVKKVLEDLHDRLRAMRKYPKMWAVCAESLEHTAITYLELRSMVGRPVQFNKDHNEVRTVWRKFVIGLAKKMKAPMNSGLTGAFELFEKPGYPEEFSAAVAQGIELVLEQLPIEQVSFFSEGTRVRAKLPIFDPPSEKAPMGVIYAEPGDEGVVVHSGRNVWPTVRFDKTERATIVTDEDVEELAQA